MPFQCVRGALHDTTREQRGRRLGGANRPDAELSKLGRLLEKFHGEVVKLMIASRARMRALANKRTLLDFKAGDSVIVARGRQPWALPKLEARGQGHGGLCSQQKRSLCTVWRILSQGSVRRRTCQGRARTRTHPSASRTNWEKSSPCPKIRGNSRCSLFRPY